MEIREGIILLTFIFAFETSALAQNSKKDSSSLKKLEYNTVDVSNTNWLHKNSLGANIEWNFRNDSTFIRTKIWPEDGPKYDLGKYKIDKRNNPISIQWGYSFLTGKTENTSYSVPELYDIVKWSEQEIVLRKQAVKKEEINDLATENNYINLIRRQ